MIAIRQPILHGVSWSSSFAAALLGLVLFTALSMIGLAVAGESLAVGNFSEVGLGSLLWMLFSLALTGYVAGTIAVKSAPGLTTKRAGLLCGSVTGSLVLLVLTMFSYNVISSTIRTTVGAAGAVAGSAAQVTGNAAAAGASQVGQLDLAAAAERVGLGEEYRALSAGTNRQELEAALAEVSPELSRAQVSATAEVVMQVLDQTRQNITSRVQNVAQLGAVVREEWQTVQQQLSGSEFSARLREQGLTPQQAQEVTNVITQRIEQVQGRAQQALQTLEQQIGQLTEVAGTAVSRSAMSWLVMAVLLVGLAALAGWLSNDEHLVEEELEEEARTRREHERQAMQHH